MAGLGLLDTLLRRRPPPPPRFAAGRVGYAVGDIHGRADLLASMMEKLEAAHPEEAVADARPIVIFLGDYVDRGPDSRKVVDLFLDQRPRGFERRFLLGNHEAAMLAFMQNPQKTRDWLASGGMSTLISYGVQPPSLGASGEALRQIAEQLFERMGPAHLEFFKSLERYVVQGDYVFVHAGVNPDKRLEAQTDEELLWIRKRFLEGRKTWDHVVVHGHTPFQQPYKDHRRISIDTGAYASGRLTAVKLQGETAEFLSVGAV